jgi:hypothetical protein
MSAPLLSIPAGRSLRREGTNFVDAMPTRGTMELFRGDDFMELSESPFYTQ